MMVSSVELVDCYVADGAKDVECEEDSTYWYVEGNRWLAAKHGIYFVDIRWL